MKDSTLLSINEFSEFTGIKQSTLRYYDEINLLPPAQRGANNYRYYKPFQIITVNFIHVLIDLGVPLSTIKALNAERTPTSIMELLSQREVILNSQLNDLQTSFSIICTYRNNIQKGLSASEGDISIQELSEENIAFGSSNNFMGSDTFYEEFMGFCRSADKYRINLRYPVGGYYTDMNAYSKAPGEPNKFFSLDPLGKSKRAAGKYLVGYNRGYYGQFGDFPQRMVSYAQEHNLVFDGPVYVVYLLDEVSVINAEQYLSQVAVGIRARR